MTETFNLIELIDRFGIEKKPIYEILKQYKLEPLINSNPRFLMQIRNYYYLEQLELEYSIIL